MENNSSSFPSFTALSLVLPGILDRWCTAVHFSLPPDAFCLALLSHLLPILLPWSRSRSRPWGPSPLRERAVGHTSPRRDPCLWSCSLPLWERGGCSTCRHAPGAACAPSLAKPQPSAFQQKKMFFKTWIWLARTRRLLSLLCIKGVCCVWKHTLLWSWPWKQWSLLSSLIFGLRLATECWFLWLCS